MTRQTLDVSRTHRLDLIQHGDQTTLHLATDVEPVLKRAERLRQAKATKTGMGDHLAAVIPIALLMEFAQKRGLTSWQAVANDDRLLDEFLTSRDYRKTRVYEGKI